MYVLNDHYSITKGGSTFLDQINVAYNKTDKTMVLASRTDRAEISLFLYFLFFSIKGVGGFLSFAPTDIGAGES